MAAAAAAEPADFLELPADVLQRIVKVVCPSTVRSFGEAHPQLGGIVKKTPVAGKELQEAFNLSARQGHKKLFFYYLRSGTLYDKRVYKIKGKKLKFTRPRVTLHVDTAFSSAARGGHTEIMVHLHELGATDYDAALVEAARGGHLEAMHLLKEMTTKLYLPDALIYAACAGQRAAVHLLKEWGDNEDNFDYALAEVAGMGDVAAMRLLEEVGTPKLKYAFYMAAGENQLEALAVLRAWGANDFDRALRHAARGSCLEAMRLLKEWGATDFVSAAVVATGRAGELLQQWMT